MGMAMKGKQKERLSTKLGAEVEFDGGWCCKT